MKLDNILARHYGITLPPKPVEEARDLVKAHNGKLNQFKWFSQEGLWSVLVSSKDAKYITNRLLNARIYTGWKFSKTLTPEGAEILHIYTEEQALKDQIGMWLTDLRPPVMVMRQEEVLAKPASLFKLKSWVKKIPNNSWNFTDYAMSRAITGKAASFLVKRLNFTKNSMGNFEWKHCVVLMEPTPLTAENPNKATTNLIILLDNFRGYMPMADAAMLQDVVKELEKLIGEAGAVMVMRQEEAIGLKLKWQQTKKPLSYELKDIDIEFGDKLLKSETGWKSSNNNPDSVYNDKYFIRLFRTESFYTMSTKTRVPSCRIQTLTLANAKTIDTEYSEYLKLKSHVMVMRQEEAAEVGYMGWTVTFEGIGMYNARTWIHDPAIVDLLKAKLFLKKRDVAGLESFEDPRGDLSIYVPKVFNKGTGYDAIVKTKDRQKEVDKVVKAAGLVNRAWVKPPVMVMRQEEAKIVGYFGWEVKTAPYVYRATVVVYDKKIVNFLVDKYKMTEVPNTGSIDREVGWRGFDNDLSIDQNDCENPSKGYKIQVWKAKLRNEVDTALKAARIKNGPYVKPPVMVMRQEEASGDKKVLKWTKFDGSYEAEVPAEFGKWYADKYNFVNTVRGSNGGYKLIQGNFLSLVTIKQPENNSWPWVFIVADNRVKIAISTAWASDVWKPKPPVMVMRQEEIAFSRTRFLPGLRKVTESKKPAPTIKFK